MTEEGPIELLLPCKDDATTAAVLTIESLVSNTDDAAVLLGTLTNSKYEKVAVKISTWGALFNEFSNGNTLFEKNIPNMMKYICRFGCNDTFDHVIYESGDPPRISNCSSPFAGDGVDCIVMPFYESGSLDANIRRKTLDLDMNNVIKQVCFAMCYAFAKTGFVHTDLDARNVLLDKASMKSVRYGNVVLHVKNFYAIITDLEGNMSRGVDLLLVSLMRFLLTCNVIKTEKYATVNTEIYTIISMIQPDNVDEPIKALGAFIDKLLPTTVGGRRKGRACGRRAPRR